jgi:hypothetical protein
MQSPLEQVELTQNYPQKLGIKIRFFAKNFMHKGYGRGGLLFGIRVETFFGIGGRGVFWWFQENRGRKNSKKARKGVWRGTRGNLGGVVGYFQTRREII